MADYGTYNFPDLKSGDSLNAKTFTFNTHPPGTLVKVELKTNRGDILRSGSGITITDAVNWVFVIDQQVINWNPGNLTYGITIKSSTGIVKTFIRGSWNIL